MHIHRAQFDVAVLSPDIVEQPFAAEHPAGMLEEMPQQAKLGRAERHGLAAALHLVADSVHLDIGIEQRLTGERRADAAQHRRHPRNQLARGEGLGDIIVCPGLQPTHPIFLLAARGEHDDRHIRRVGTAAQLAAQFDARQPLDHPVEQDDVGQFLLHPQQRFLAIGGMADGEPLSAEMPDDEFRQRGIVLDQKHIGLGHAVGPYAVPVTGSAGFSPFSRSPKWRPVAVK